MRGGREGGNMGQERGGATWGRRGGGGKAR